MVFLLIWHLGVGSVRRYFYMIFLVFHCTSVCAVGQLDTAALAEMHQSNLHFASKIFAACQCQK